MIQLIANPDKFHGRRVAVVGFMRLEFESSGLYLHEEDSKHSLGPNGLAIWLDRKLMTSESRCQDKQYVALFGVFNARKTGHKGMFSGSLESIARCLGRQPAN